MENLSPHAAVQSHQSLGELVAVPMDELEHISRCTRHCGPDSFIILQSRVDAYKFSFFQELL